LNTGAIFSNGDIVEATLLLLRCVVYFLGAKEMIRVVVGMSILSIRPRTMHNLNYLFEFSKTNVGFEVRVFNKSGVPLGNFPKTSNFSIQPVIYENLYQTMSRLDLVRFSHILWLNDDDSFTLPSTNDLSVLDYNSVVYPEMSICTSTRELEVDWRPIFQSRSRTEAFENYWTTASPLFFCMLPVNLFRVWIDYIEKMEIYLPHLDTQFNLLAVIQEDRRMLPNFSYSYGAENWETPEKLIESANRFSRELQKSDDFIYCMELIRNIDNVCILGHYASAFDIHISASLLRAVLLRFGPLQNGRASMIILKVIVRNLFPMFLRRKLLLFRITDLNRKAFYSGLPSELIDFFLGSKVLRTPEELLEELSREKMAEYLMISESMVNIWRINLTSLISRNSTG
jgi:hypothetical protein